MPAGAAAAEGEVRHYSRLRVNLLTRQWCVSVVMEHWGIDVTEGLARQMHYHGRYEKRKRQNIVQKLFCLA